MVGNSANRPRRVRARRFRRNGGNPAIYRAGALAVSEYARGNNYERKVADLLRGDGYEVWQTRGSKSYADLIAIKAGEILLVQVKGANAPIGWYEWNGLHLLAEKVGAVPLIADFPEWRKGKAGPVRFRVILGMRKKFSRESNWPCGQWTADEIAEALF